MIFKLQFLFSMALRFMQSEKGMRKLVDNGYVYIRDKCNGENTFWKCEYARSQKCHGRIHTTGDSILKRVGEHNHSGDACRAEVLDIMHNVIERAITTQEGSHNIVGCRCFKFCFSTSTWSANERQQYETSDSTCT